MISTLGKSFVWLKSIHNLTSTVFLQRVVAKGFFFKLEFYEVNTNGVLNIVCIRIRKRKSSGKWFKFLLQIIGSIWIMSFAIAWPVFARSTTVNDNCGMDWKSTQSDCNGTKIVDYVRFACNCGFTDDELSVSRGYEVKINLCFISTVEMTHFKLLLFTLANT